MLQPNTPAPAFSAITTDGSILSSSDLIGKNVVLYFYPADNTGGCTREACDFRDARPQFDVADAVVLGVSCDDQASHQDFTGRYDLNFPLLVDADGEICGAFGVPIHGTQPQRVTFLIDRQGMIRRVWEEVHVVGHAAEVHAAVMSLESNGSDL